MSKLKLTDVEWGEFKVKDIFEVTNSKPYHKNNLKITEKGIPYITRTSFNNGLEEVVENINVHKNPKNTISLGAENADFFYQSVEYITGNKMYFIQNDKISKNVGIFLVQSFRNSIKDSGFGYGKGLTGTRFKERIVMLPMDFQGQPNWQFMEDYIKQEQQVQARKVIDYYEQKLIELAADVVGLDKVEWKEFSIESLFNIKIGKNVDGNKVDRENGKTAYITRKENTNGLDGFIDEDSSFLNTNYPVITIGNETAEPFVQEFPFFTGTKVNILTPKFDIDVPVLKYIATSLRQHKNKYSYSFTINSTRLKKQNILLPTDESGNPNWKYMSDFVKKMELDKVNEVLEYIYIYISN